MTDAVEDARLAMVRARNARGAERKPQVAAARSAYVKLNKAADAFADAMTALGGLTAPGMARAIADSVGHADTVLQLEEQAVAADLAAT